jgi:hypothetical protein
MRSGSSRRWHRPSPQGREHHDDGLRRGLAVAGHEHRRRSDGHAAIQAAQATETELAGIFPNDTAAELWHMIGITPLIGVNDQADEVFTPADATQVANWASSTGIGRLSFWSLTKDAECPGGANQGDANTCSSIVQTPWEFSDIFERA